MILVLSFAYTHCLSLEDLLTCHYPYHTLVLILQLKNIFIWVGDVCKCNIQWLTRFTLVRICTVFVLFTVSTTPSIKGFPMLQKKKCRSSRCRDGRLRFRTGQLITPVYGLLDTLPSLKSKIKPITTKTMTGEFWEKETRDGLLSFSQIVNRGTSLFRNTMTTAKCWVCASHK